MSAQNGRQQPPAVPPITLHVPIGGQVGVDGENRVVIFGAIGSGDAAALQAVKLTARQRDVVALLDAGLLCWEIADRLQIAEKTVRRHVEDIAKELPGEQTPLKRIRKHARELLNAPDEFHRELGNYP